MGRLSLIVNNIKVKIMNLNKIITGPVKGTRVVHSPATSIETDKIEFDIDGDNQLFVEDDDYINTGSNLFEKGRDWTLLIDFTDNGICDWTNSLFILHNFYEGEYQLCGFNIQKTGEAQGNRLSFQVNENYYATKPLINGTKTRLVLRYTFPATLEMYFNDEELASYLPGASNGYFKFNYGNPNHTIDSNLYLACWYNEREGGIGRFWRGEINEFVIWNNIALTEDEIRYILSSKKNVE